MITVYSRCSSCTLTQHHPSPEVYHYTRTHNTHTTHTHTHTHTRCMQHSQHSLPIHSIQKEATVMQIVIRSC